jgi:large subunit ribosomal protein L18
MSRQTAQQKKARIKRKIRSQISGTATRPRLSVFRSNTAFYAQLIDDTTATTLASASTTGAKGTKMANAIAAGADLAKAAKAKGIESVVFDRNGFKYAGRIKAFADAAREAGLIF